MEINFIEWARRTDLATVNDPQDDDLRVPLSEYIKLGFDNISGRLDAAQTERAVLKADIDKVSERVDKLMFTIIGAAVVLSAAIIGAAAAIIASQ